VKRFAFAVPLILILIIPGCRKNEDPVRRSMEHGVEVVTSDPGFDRSSPGRILELKQEAVIDLSAADLVQRGLADPAAFDVDAEGNVLVWSQTSNDVHFFKFSAAGVLLSYFGRTGQGPGEVLSLTSVYFEANGELMAWDNSQGKMVFFDGRGAFLRQNPLLRRPWQIIPLGDGRYVTQEQQAVPAERMGLWTVLICGPDLAPVREIGRRTISWPGPGRKFSALSPPVVLGVSKSYVFYGNGGDGYEIRCFDKGGRLIRIIRKVYQAVPLSAEDRGNLAKIYEGFPPEFKANVEYPESFPPFQMGFADDEDRLFVMTYERSGEKGHYWHDVFGPDGAYAGRVSLGNCRPQGWSQGILFASARRGRIYHLRENKDGYRELAIWRMR
jgi:hypothetical protein